MRRLLVPSRQLIFAACLLAISSQPHAELLKDYKLTNRVIVTFSNAESNSDRLLLIQQIKQYSCQYRKRDLVHVDLIEGTEQYKHLSRKFSLTGHTHFNDAKTRNSLWEMLKILLFSEFRKCRTNWTNETSKNAGFKLVKRAHSQGSRMDYLITSHPQQPNKYRIYL